MPSFRVLRGLDPVRFPYFAFARLWHSGSDHSAWNEGWHDPGACVEAAEAMLVALREDSALPDVPLPSALRAVDRFLSELRLADGRIRGIPAAEGHYDDCYVVQRPRDWRSRYSETKSNYKQYWAEHHYCVPAVHEGIKIKLVEWEDERISELRWPFKALAGGFTDGITPHWLDPCPPYRCRTLTDSNVRWGSVLEYLQQANREGVNVLVLPELTVDLVVLERARAWLQDNPTTLRLVAAGSFHVEVVKGRDVEERMVYSVAPLLGPQGQVLIEHKKIQPWRHESTKRYEEINAGVEVYPLMTNLGLVALAICIDFCELASAGGVGTIWSKVQPSLALVPSMGQKTTNDAHGRRAEELGKVYSTRVLVASQHDDREEGLGIAYVLSSIPEACAPCLLTLFE